jgi:hypothetical protein
MKALYNTKDGKLIISLSFLLYGHCTLAHSTAYASTYI